MNCRALVIGLLLGSCCSASVHAQLENHELRRADKLSSHGTLQQKASNSHLEVLPEYPGDCDPFPIPTTPIGPSIVRNLVDYNDEYQLTVWRYPCDEQFSWIIFTVDPVGQSEPFVCSQIILAQDVTIAEDYTLTQDPVVEDGSFCDDVTAKRSFAVSVWGFAETFIDLQQEFQVAWDLFGGDEQITMFAYNPEEYGIGGPPQLNNQVAANGLYYDPNKSGHGFDLNVFSAGTVVYYYGHTSGGERLWLISELYDGQIQFGHAVHLDMFEIVEGTFFNPDSSPSVWGSLTLTFEDCDSGMAALSGVDGANSMSFIRLAGLEGENCQSFSVSAASAE